MNQGWASEDDEMLIVISREEDVESRYRDIVRVTNYRMQGNYNTRQGECVTSSS